jgi:hypothetical protein
MQDVTIFLDRLPLRSPWLRVAMMGFLLSGSGGAEPIHAPTDPKAIPALQAVIQPTPGEEPWREIAWETDLTAARRKAAAAQKPIFLWEMDGHPLGCT